MTASPLLHPFYPIAPDIDWLKRIVPLGVKTVQLRIKNTPMDEVRRQIEEAVPFCASHGCTLIVNDYWLEALMLGAKFIHLGQEDLASADLVAIRAKRAKLGVSTHSHEELQTALKARPDYVALGPIWETRLKKMPWRPQGLERLQDWVEKSPVPVVAIGGVTLERAPKVFATGAASIAVVSDIVGGENPEARVKDWLQLCNASRG